MTLVCSPSSLFLSLSELCSSSVTQVQIDCLEKFVAVIEYLVQNVENADLLIKEYLFQSIVQTIANGNNRVNHSTNREKENCFVKIRKGSQAALIRLFELEQMKVEQIEEEILPSLCQLDRASDDFKNEAILVRHSLSLFSLPSSLFPSPLSSVVDSFDSICFQ